MAEEPIHVDTVVEDIDEDNYRAPTPDAKAQPTSQGPVPVVVDEADTVKKSVEPSKEATTEASTSEDLADKQTQAEPEKQEVKPKYKIRDENRVPQWRVNQLARQRRIAESRYSEVQQKHLELIDYLERLSKSNPSLQLPQELVSRFNAERQELLNLRTKQHEARLDEADGWLKTELQKYTDSGFQLPSSFEKELIEIVQAEGLTDSDPLEAYKKAFKIWSDEYIALDEEPAKADTSNQNGSGKPAAKVSTPDPKTIREEAKKKATGVTKAKTTIPVDHKSKEKWTGHHYYAVDEDPRY